MRVDLDAFERMYAANDDPWNFADAQAEQRRYAITVASLPWPRYRRCFEPGCSIGALTERLAAVADQVVAQDASPTATRHAAARVAEHANVEVRVGAIPEVWPDGAFDLVVFSDIGYYWDVDELEVIAARLRASTEPGGHLIGVHWLGESADHLLAGAVVHDVLNATFGSAIVHHVDTTFLLDVWTRP